MSIPVQRNTRIDATEELANILLGSSGFRWQRYEDMKDLVPYADVNSKVVTREDEYVPIGKLSIDWDLPGEKSLFEAFLQYEYLPLMSDLLQNYRIRNTVQELMNLFLEHGATISNCHFDIVSILENASLSLLETSNAINLVYDICNTRDKAHRPSR